MILCWERNFYLPWFQRSHSILCCRCCWFNGVHVFRSTQEGGPWFTFISCGQSAGWRLRLWDSTCGFIFISVPAVGCCPRQEWWLKRTVSLKYRVVCHKCLCHKNLCKAVQTLCVPVCGSGDWGECMNFTDDGLPSCRLMEVSPCLCEKHTIPV